MKVSGAAATARGKLSPPAAELPPASSGPTVPVLQFGDTLFKAFTQQKEGDTTTKLPMTRYADYLHHFGFSVERESGPRGKANASGGADKPVALSIIKPASSRTLEYLINYGSEDPSALADTADWGIDDEVKKEADQRCESVGAISGVPDCETVAKQLTAPYNSVTWRQTATQCALKKTRCVYAWLCANFSLQLRPLDETTSEAETAPVTSVSKSPHRAPAGKKTNRMSKKVKEVAVVQEPAGPVDPLVQAMTTRRATPELLAQLYANMLGAVGVKCEVVTGQLKGVAPGEAFEWVWNIVHLDGRSYLVDIAAALSNGLLRSPSVPSTVAPTESAKTVALPPTAASGASAESIAPSIPTSGAKQKGTAIDEGATATDWGTPRLLSTTPAELRRDFFFFTHPCLFLSSHLPANAAQSLVSIPIKPFHWVLQPCVTPAFYHYDLQLTSHPTHAAISAGSTPTYISLANKAPGKTELCCVLFSGTLQTLSEDLASNAPLPPGWVWHQREDAANVETFTLTVPEAGFYAAVIGARSIRPDPYSAALVAAAASAFTPVVSYEVRVGFTSSSVPVLPRQYLSPCICRLTQPLCAQVTPGIQKFCVMPSCSNVHAVAVVRRAALQGTAITTAAAATPSSSSSNSVSNHNSSGRSLLCFLTFQMKSATFEGSAAVKAGDIIELWILYGAPDRNGQQLMQRVAAMKAPVVEAPAVVVSKVADKRKKKVAAMEQHLVDEAQLSRLRHALSRGELFQPFVGGIEVKHFISPTVVSVIQPQPTVERERAATLRRLAGVTDALMREADYAAQHEATPVGSYFGVVATTATKR